MVSSLDVKHHRLVTYLWLMNEYITNENSIEEGSMCLMVKTFNNTGIGKAGYDYIFIGAEVERELPEINSPQNIPVLPSPPRNNHQPQNIPVLPSPPRNNPSTRNQNENIGENTTRNVNSERRNVPLSERIDMILSENQNNRNQENQTRIP